MKKTLLYITIFLLGIAVGYVYLDNKYHKLNLESSKLNNSSFNEVLSAYQKRQFSDLQGSVVNKPLIVKGVVKGVYTNTDRELIIHVEDKNIAAEINCTLSGNDIQIKQPLKLGQEINIRGVFEKFDEQIFLRSCKLLDVASIK